MTDMEQLLAVAKMYYEQGLTQQEIAEKVFLSRSHVSRMLKEARALGIVEIIIRSPFENHVSLEISLAERFGMEKILVAYTENTGPREEFNSVCSMGASYLNSILTNRSVLAVSKGKTVAATIGAHQSGYRRDVYSAAGGRSVRMRLQAPAGAVSAG